MVLRVLYHPENRWVQLDQALLVVLKDLEDLQDLSPLSLPSDLWDQWLHEHLKDPRPLEDPEDHCYPCSLVVLVPLSVHFDPVGPVCR